MGKGRAPCCDKSQVKKGPWSPAEDLRLMAFIRKHGHENWRALPKQAGLLRCGKSCRLRWINYLRPDLKRGSFTKEEEDLIIMLHQSLGNKWSKIASHFPGRTDNEIKNVWNTHFKKRLASNDAKPESSSTRSSSSSCNIDMSQEPSTYATSSSSNNSSSVINTTRVDDTQQGEGAAVEMEIPLESDVDFWNMLNSLSNPDNEVIKENASQESITSKFGDTQLEDIENKMWLNDLKNELGLEETSNGDQENLLGDVNIDFMQEINSELECYDLWPSI